MSNGRLEPKFVFNTSKSTLVIAVVAIGLCGWLWYERLGPIDIFPSPPAPRVAVNTTKQAEMPVPAFMLEGGTAPVIARINWSDPKNPAAIALDYPNFLFDSQEGLQVWNLDTLEMTPLMHPLGKVKLLDFAKIRTQHSITVFGTLFAVESPESGISLYWVPDNKTNFQQIPTGEKAITGLQDKRPKVEMQLNLPSGFYPDASFGLTAESLLLCSSASKKAIVAGIRNNELVLLTSENDSRLYSALQERRVIGDVEGVGIIQEPDSGLAHESPLVFDINTCRWKASNLPEFMAQGLDLKILPDGYQDINAASWLDLATHELQTLRTPLAWDRTSHQWKQQRKASDIPGLTPEHSTLPLMGKWYYAASPREGKFEFLWGWKDRWCEPKQTLPVTEDLKLLPIGNDGVLALLIDSEGPGRVVRLYPRNPFGPAFTNDEHTEGNAATSISSHESTGRNRFPSSLSYYFSSIQLNDGSAVILDGEKVNILSPDTNIVTKLQSLPQSQQRMSGVQLNDGSMVVFGGLSTACDASNLNYCTQNKFSGYRWIKDEKRWQTLPTLMVPFAFGTPFDGGNSGIATAYDRADFLVKNGTALYYLAQNRLTNVWNDKPTPSFLFRWKPDNDPEKLTPTQSSRYESSLIELNDGRLAAVGGTAEKEPQSPACQACWQKRKLEVERIARDLTNRRKSIANNNEDGEEESMDPEQRVPQCEACSSIQLGDYYTYTRSSEIYDEKSNQWYYGPFSIYPGGRAVKLANGKLFKFGMNGYNATDADYVAEVADSALKKWEATPPFPFSKPDALVSQILAVGNQVLIVMKKPSERYVVWDDVSGSWQIHDLPKYSDWGFNHIPAHVSAINNNQLLLIFKDGFEYISWPIQD